MWYRFIIQGGMGVAFSGWALAQVRAEALDELGLVAAGDDLTRLKDFVPPGRDSFTATDVLRVPLRRPRFPG